MTKRLTQEEQHKKMIDDIINNFDFVKCRKTMVALGWTWAFNGTPSVDEMKKTAKYLMNGAIEGCLESKSFRPGVTYMHATGGFKAEAIKNKYGYLEHLKLEFVVTEWDSDGD